MARIIFLSQQQVKELKQQFWGRTCFSYTLGLWQAWSNLPISAASCSHSKAKPNCLLQMSKITGKSKVQHAENRDSHVCEPCQDGLIFFLCTFILKKINPICFIKNFFSWLWKQKIKNACF